MTTAYYLAAHGAHFPIEPASPPRQTTPTPTPPKTTRADSVTSTIYSPYRHTIHSQLTSPFFRLPAELRNEIYTLLLCANSPASLPTNTKTRIPTPSQPHAAILSTCKRIHAEATPLLYLRPIFHANPALLTSLPHLISPAKPIVCASAIKRIRRWQLTVRLDTDPRFTATQARDAFSGAEFFELRVWQTTFDGCNAAVLKLFTGVRGVGLCRVTGSVEEGLARWLEGRMMAPLEEETQVKWCECKGERYVRCENCQCRTRLNENGSGLWVEDGDAWRFGNR